MGELDSLKNKSIRSLAKLTLEELEELCERQKNVLKNKSVLSHLPDKGKQLKENLESIEKELELRKNLSDINSGMKNLSINPEAITVLKEKHVQYICNIEKSPGKERYKPSSTLVKKDETKSEKPTKLIPLAESLKLLTQQNSKMPAFEIMSRAEVQIAKQEEAYSDVEDQQDSTDDSD